MNSCIARLVLSLHKIEILQDNPVKLDHRFLHRFVLHCFANAIARSTDTLLVDGKK